MKVLVIVVSYNFEPWMERCLGSLRASEFPVSVLVVDNDSADGTVQLLRKHYPEVRVIENKSNVGFGAANNMGMSLALEEGFDAVFLLNQDAWVDKQTVGTLLQLSGEYPMYGILSPVHLTGKGDALDQSFAAYSKMDAVDRLPISEAIVPCPFINAALWLIPAKVLRTVGGFSPLFYHYGEDKDYVNRLHYYDLRVGYSPAVFGYHGKVYQPAGRDRFFHIEKVYLLSEYANINYSFLRAFGYGVLAASKKAMQALVRGRVRDAGRYLCISAYLLSRTKKVCEKRKKMIPLPRINSKRQ